MRARILLLCLLLLLAAACTNDSPDQSAPTPTRATQSLVVAVSQGAKGVGLYRVGVDRRAMLLRTVTPSERAAHAYGMTLSAGPTPTLCVFWKDVNSLESDPSVSEVRCYGPGDRELQVKPVVGSPHQQVAVRADGRALAVSVWLDGEGRGRDLVILNLAGGKVTEQKRWTYWKDDQGTSSGCASYPFISLAWVDDERLLLGCHEDNDYTGGLVLQPVSGGNAVEVPVEQPPYDQMLGVVSADTAGGLGIQGQYCELVEGVVCHDDPRRAVRFDLTTGKVVEVIATPAEGRAVTSVSGGEHGIVYVTSALSSDGWRGARVYLRLPGERRGVLVTGLPDGEIIAQP